MVDKEPKSMKIGIFDSGIGGLIIERGIIEALPGYDYHYLGDTARVPYGNRSPETICEMTKRATAYLLSRNCGLVIIACNTACAEALKHIQRIFLPTIDSDQRVLGVLAPAAEAAAEKTRSGRIGVLATRGTVSSNAFVNEFRKVLTGSFIFQQPAPLLVPLIENNGIKWIGPILDEYLEPLLLAKIDTLILGCTHYPFLKEIIREKVGPKIEIISQDEVIPERLAHYLERHPDFERKLSRGGTRIYEVTDCTNHTNTLAHFLCGDDIDLKEVRLER